MIAITRRQLAVWRREAIHLPEGIERTRVAGLLELAERWLDVAAFLNDHGDILEQRIGAGHNDGLDVARDELSALRELARECDDRCEWERS